MFLQKFFFIFMTVHCGYSYLNFYLDLAEVQRFFGLEAKVYYVEDGNIKRNAIDFTVDIPASIDSLHFTWQNLADYPIPYSIKLDSSNIQILPTPKLNISSTGNVPTTIQTFAITLSCSGVKSADVNLTITIKVNISQDNVTTLVINRKKTCPEFDNTNYISKDPQFSNAINMFYIAVCCAVLLILLLVSFVTLYYVKNKKTRRPMEVNNGPSTTTTTFLAALPRNSVNASSYGSFRKMPSYSVIDDRSKFLQERITELTIQRCRVRLDSVILEGTFGRVYQGAYTNEDGNEETVIIKTVTDHASQVQISLLLQEGMAMYSLNQKNILSILRVSIEDHTAPFLLYPYNNYTNLKIFLQKCKVSSEGVSHTLTTQEVVDMALQIIQAMQYLHKKHLLHKDLAARNCVVDDKLNVLVADNALSRDLFPSDYHCLGDNENRPVKWLAIESLLHKSFSSSSDVWSFGVLLWELTTLAQQPYIEIDPFEMAAYLKDGYRLAQPINCPDELFAVMAYCWAMSADERPTFTQLYVCLQEFYAQLTRYV